MRIYFEVYTEMGIHKGKNKSNISCYPDVTTFSLGYLRLTVRNDVQYAKSLTLEESFQIHLLIMENVSLWSLHKCYIKT